MKAYGPLIFAAFIFVIMIILTWVTNERRKRRYRKNKVLAKENFEVFHERLDNLDRRFDRSDLGIELINKKIDLYVKEKEAKKTKSTGDDTEHTAGKSTD